VASTLLAERRPLGWVILRGSYPWKAVVYATTGRGQAASGAHPPVCLEYHDMCGKRSTHSFHYESSRLQGLLCTCWLLSICITGWQPSPTHSTIMESHRRFLETRITRHTLPLVHFLWCSWRRRVKVYETDSISYLRTGWNGHGNRDQWLHNTRAGKVSGGFLSLVCVLQETVATMVVANPS
jgi:hypothetical protein